MSDKTSNLTEYWVSRDHSGGWVHWENKAHYRGFESSRYPDGRPANECEQSLLSKNSGMASNALPETDAWVSRDPFGGWVYWIDELQYLDFANDESLKGQYYDGRPANECEQSLIAKMRPIENEKNSDFAVFLGEVINKNTPPSRLN